MPAKDVLADSAAALRPTGRRLLQHVIDVEVGVLAGVRISLVAKNDVRLGLIAEDQE